MTLLLSITAVLEMATGAALLAVPSVVATILLGDPLESPASQAVARVAGAALCALGLACWNSRNQPQGRALVTALLLYNVAVAAVMVQARLGADVHGIGLWPAAVLHTALAGWCVSILRVRV